MKKVKRLLKRIRNYGEKLLMSRSEYEQYKSLSKKDRAAYHELNKGYKRVFKLMSKSIARNHIDKITKAFSKRRSQATVQQIKNELERASKERTAAEETIQWTMQNSPYQKEGHKVEGEKKYNSLVEELEDKAQVIQEREQSEVLRIPSKDGVEIQIMRMREREIAIIKNIRAVQDKEQTRSR